MVLAFSRRNEYGYVIVISSTEVLAVEISFRCGVWHVDRNLLASTVEVE